MLQMNSDARKIAYYHLPGLFEFYELYKKILHIWKEHREYFYPWCEIGSIYGAPYDCIFGGGRVGFGDADAFEVSSLMKEHGLSARLTFSNSFIEEKHLTDKKCNELLKVFDEVHSNKAANGIIIYSDLLMDYIKKKYPSYYFVSSTTKVITDYDEFLQEVKRPDFDYVVPDFRLNKSFEKLEQMTQHEKDKVEFLCNECCWYECSDRKKCYETVSLKSLSAPCEEHLCKAPKGGQGYRFSEAMKNQGFIGIDDIKNKYMPMGFSNFKIEGRGLGSAIILEMILYYMVKPECQILVREEVYLDSMLDLF